MKRNPEAAREMIEERAVAQGVYGKYTPGKALDKETLIESAKIKSERESMKTPDKDKAYRYSDPSKGEVAQVYDNPADQAMFEKRVKEFRQAMRSLMPYVNSQDPRPRSLGSTPTE